MHACGVLSPQSNVILSHANHIAQNDVKLVKENGAYLSSTPSVELQMGMGTPVCFDTDRDVQSCSALGVDCHNVVLASIVSEMRCALVNSRAVYNGKFLAAGKMPAKLNHTVQDVYALGTIHGARAVGMEKDIGSLEVGKKADIIVFDAVSPSMICGAQRDPVTAIVMHSTPGDIVMTFVDGILRKTDGKVIPVQLTSEDGKFAGADATTLNWSDVSKNLLQTQTTLEGKINGLDLEAVKNDACAAFGMDPSMITSTL
jgi:cytosine/adenosine deaminase-related metal-dependent hydrolase